MVRSRKITAVMARRGAIEAREGGDGASNDRERTGTKRTARKALLGDEDKPVIRAKKKPGSEKEIRVARFLSKPNAAVRERISRAFTHRLYLIDKKLSGEPPSACDFFVLGATGNVYTVALGIVPSCTCPDHEKGNTCKHILFVMLRVLKLPPDDSRVWQKALLPSELNALLHNLSVNHAVLASGLVRERFEQITGECSSCDREIPKPLQRDIDGDCPICCEPMASNDGKPLELVVFCKMCGNNVHSDCFKRWSQSKTHGHATCIYCRAVWECDTDIKGRPSHGEYINLASYSDAHGPDETSIEALYPESYQWWHRSR